MANCSKSQCTDVNSGESLSRKVAINLEKLYQRGRTHKSLRWISWNKQRIEIEIVPKWEQNMFQCSAKQVGLPSCMTCYNARRSPQIMPIPGFDTAECNSTGTCFAYCVIQKAKGYGKWTDDGWICPQELLDELQSWITPVVNMAEGTVFPYCIARGREMIGELHLNVSNPQIQCKDESVHVTQIGLNKNKI